jgi:hypothetical protein
MDHYTPFLHIYLSLCEHSLGKKYAQFLPHTLTAISNDAANLLMKNGHGK